ncbi:MAG: DUF4173 domain-containing protein [Gemmatimonadota bacterium]|nr:MAG: DUF4173 domain-containing protein [Gemmatimonadota bacterium]
MTCEHTRSPLRILLVAGLLGAMGDALLHTTPWGLNVGLWAAAVGTASRMTSPASQKGTGPWLMAAWAFAAFMAWRASAFLNFWNFLAAVTCLTLVALQTHQVRLPAATIFRYLSGALDTAWSAAVGSLLLVFGDVKWDSAARNPLTRSRPVLVGVALATPLVLVFGTLLTAADPVFANTVASVFDWNFASITSHVFVGCGIAWLVAGYLRYLVFTHQSFAASLPEPKSPALGMVEIGIALGTTTLIFTIFVTIQIQYLFGGEQLVQDSLGLSYAEYARRGFFETVTAAALIVPVLLVADWMLDTSSHKNRQSFAALATVLLLLIAVVLLSALKRMQLYVEVYGLTEDRLYATAFLVWIAFVLAWLAITVLRGRYHRFAYGTVVSGLLVVAALNILNPAAVIARTNLGRAQSGHSLDVPHLAMLGADAAPTILSRFPILTEADRCTVAAVMAEQRWASQRADWRTWNLARHRARRMLRDSEGVNHGCGDLQTADRVTNGG